MSQFFWDLGFLQHKHPHVCFIREDGPECFLHCSSPRQLHCLAQGLFGKPELIRQISNQAADRCQLPPSWDYNFLQAPAMCLLPVSLRPRRPIRSEQIFHIFQPPFFFSFYCFFTAFCFPATSPFRFVFRLLFLFFNNNSL